MAGASNDPVVETSTSKVPNDRPVQEKDTNTRVKAMNKIFRKPVVESAFIQLVDQEAGSVISKAPKKEMANTTNRAKNNRLNTALVDMLLRALAPKSL